MSSENKTLTPTWIAYVDGAPQMEVQIEAKLHRLDKGERTRAYENKTTSQIIKEIISKHNLTAEVEEFGPKHNYTEQRNITDYDYITRLAYRYGKAVWCQGSTVHVKTEITPSDDDVILERGKSIISARTKTSITKQLSAATCTGWSMMDCRGFTATATMKDIPLRIGGEYSWEDNSKGYDPKKIEQITTEEIIDEEDAAAVAKAYIQNRSFKFQSCDIKTQGNYHIKPGNRLMVKYIGKQSDGEYLIESVEHTLDMQGGFITRCHLIRNFCEVSNRSGTASEIDRERADSTVLVSNNMWFHIGQNMSEGNHVFIGTENNHNENTSFASNNEIRNISVKNETNDLILIKPESDKKPYTLLRPKETYYGEIDGIIFPDGAVYKTNGASKYVATIDKNANYKLHGGKVKDLAGNVLKGFRIMVKADLEIRGIDKDNTIMRWEDYYGLYHYGKDKQEFLKSWLCSEKELDINNDQISETKFIPFPLQNKNVLPIKSEILNHWKNCIKSVEKE